MCKWMNPVLFGLLLGWPTPPAAAKPREASEKQKSVRAPANFVEMRVAGVVETNGGKAVVLKEKKSDGYLLPIWIGESEALSIQLRLNRRRFQRPLTHDLLDTIMQRLGGQLVKIHVDDLRNNTFVGTVFIRHRETVISIDARPSDSIALALGNRAPIFVSSDVLKRAGIREEKATPPVKPQTEDPEELLRNILESDREEHTL